MIEQKSFDIVGEGLGMRIYENGRCYQKAIYFQGEDVQWLLDYFKEFFWVKGERVWSRSRRSS